MVKRRLDNPHQRRAQRETNNHRDAERESHFHNRPAKVFEMLEKRLGGFGLRWITKFKNVSQRHRIAFVRIAGDFSLTPGFSQVQRTQRMTNRFNGFGLR
jgi:hypothetical protein